MHQQPQADRLGVSYARAGPGLSAHRRLGLRGPASRRGASTSGSRAVGSTTSCPTWNCGSLHDLGIEDRWPRLCGAVDSAGISCSAWRRRWPAFICPSRRKVMQFPWDHAPPRSRPIAMCSPHPTLAGRTPTTPACMGDGKFDHDWHAPSATLASRTRRRQRRRTQWPAVGQPRTPA